MKTKKDLLLTIRVAMVMLAVLIGCTVSIEPAIAAEATYSFRWANFSGPATHVEVAHSIDMMNKLEQLSNGRMKFTNYMNGSLVTGSGMVEGTRSGITDFATGWFPYHTGMNPLFGFDSLPGVWVDIPHAIRAEADIERMKFWNKNLLNPQNIQLLGMYLEGPSWLVGRKKEIKVPADLKGLKIRGYGPLEEFVKNQGANPIHLTAGDLYEALMRGVVDGMMLTPGTVKTRKIYEVIEHMLAYPITISEVCTWMNLDRWNKMSPKDQEMVRSTVMEMNVKFSLKQLAEVSAGSEMMKLLGKRVHIYEANPEQVALWVQALRPVRDSYVAGLNPPSQQIVNEYMNTIVKKHMK